MLRLLCKDESSSDSLLARREDDIDDMVTVLEAADSFEDHIPVEAKFLPQGGIRNDDDEAASSIDSLRLAAIGIVFAHNECPV